MEEPIVLAVAKSLRIAAFFSFILCASAPEEATAQTYVAPVVTVCNLGPYGGYLYGASKAIQAQGQFLVDNQKALQMKEVVLQKRLETKRKAQEQWLWERDHLPTYADQQERYETELVILSRHASLTEVWSGKALNRLLDDLPSQFSGSPAGAVELKPEMLAKISVTTKTDGGPNIAVFKGGRLTWPLPFYRPEFAEARHNLDQLVATAYKQAARGPLTPELRIQFEPVVDDLTAQVRANAKIWPVRDYVDAKGFVNQLDDAVRVMRQPDAADYLQNRLAAQGRTVADLIRHMKSEGLHFGPAAAGSERFYTSLYYLVRDYHKEAGTAERAPR
jgi:hypothetical protein